MGYNTFKGSPKNVIVAADIGPGQIQLEHLDPGLFQQIQEIALHNHSGAKSRRIRLEFTEGAYGINGFYMYDDTGAHRYKVTIHSGAWTLTEA